MFARILLVLLISPIVELALLIQLGNVIGFWPTIAIIAATAIAGSILLKQQGLAVWKTLQRRLARGEMPGAQIVDGVIVLVCGALLVTPGVLTDVVGFVGLVPLTRIPIRNNIIRRFAKKLETGAATMSFGMFGGGAFEPPTHGPDNHPFGHDPQTGDEWQGRGATNPKYTRPDDPGSGDDRVLRR